MSFRRRAGARAALVLLGPVLLAGIAFADAARKEPVRVVTGVKVVSFGKVVFQGAVDLGPTLDRIARGEKYGRRNDGTVFSNREHRLPKRPEGYYREYVHPTPDVAGAGPQRVIGGRDGDFWYTPDHYLSFVRLN